MKAQAKKRLLYAIRALLLAILFFTFGITLFIKVHFSFFLLQTLLWSVYVLAIMSAVYYCFTVYYELSSAYVLYTGSILSQKLEQGSFLSYYEMKQLEDAKDLLEELLSEEYDKYKRDD